MSKGNICQNFLLTIPISSIRNGELVDSIFKTDTAISNVENLIIDLRNNTGGRSITFATLFPLIYTNPILRVNSAYYCTEDGLKNDQKHIEEIVNNKNIDSSELNEWIDLVKQEQDSIGNFLHVPQDTLILAKILSYPKNVGIIINYGCQSATEIFLLEAKQSKKVTLFGENTAGAIDYLNYDGHQLPSGNYTLYIPENKRVIPRGQKKLDGIGISPDVQINDTISDWVNFVKEYYEER